MRYKVILWDELPPVVKMKILRVTAISLILLGFIAGCASQPLVRAENANYVFCTADDVCGFRDYGANKGLVVIKMVETPGCESVYLSKTKRVADLFLWECGGLICSSKDFKTVNCAAPFQAMTIKIQGNIIPLNNSKEEVK